MGSRCHMRQHPREEQRWGGKEVFSVHARHYPLLRPASVAACSETAVDICPTTARHA